MVGLIQPYHFNLSGRRSDRRLTDRHAEKINTVDENISR